MRLHRPSTPTSTTSRMALRRTSSRTHTPAASLPLVLSRQSSLLPSSILVQPVLPRLRLRLLPRHLRLKDVRLRCSVGVAARRRGVAQALETSKRSGTFAESRGRLGKLNLVTAPCFWAEGMCPALQGKRECQRSPTPCSQTPALITTPIAPSSLLITSLVTTRHDDTILYSTTAFGVPASRERSRLIL